MEADDAIFVGIMGSLTIYDWQANLNVLLTDIWHLTQAAQVRELCRSVEAEVFTLCKWIGTNAQCSMKAPLTLAQERPAAHRGYLGRSQHIPVEELYALAQSRGKRLVLTRRAF